MAENENKAMTLEGQYSNKYIHANYYIWEDGGASTLDERVGYFVSNCDDSTLKIKKCLDAPVLGVTIARPELVGDENATYLDDPKYALVATTGVVKVRCSTGSIIPGDFVMPGGRTGGIASKTDDESGYRVIEVENISGTPYVTIDLGECTSAIYELSHRSNVIEKSIEAYKFDTDMKLYDYEIWIDDAKDEAKKAVNASDKALNTANEAINTADNALNTAESALDAANEAHDMADEAINIAEKAVNTAEAMTLEEKYSNKYGHANYYIWWDENTNNTNRIGHFVSNSSNSALRIYPTHNTPILGVTVASSAFVGNRGNAVQTKCNDCQWQADEHLVACPNCQSTNITYLDKPKYALVATTGIVKVRCATEDIAPGDFVMPYGSMGVAARTDDGCGYRVIEVDSSSGVLYVAIDLGACTSTIYDLGRRSNVMEKSIENAKIDIASALMTANKALNAAEKAEKDSGSVKDIADEYKDIFENIDNDIKTKVDGAMDIYKVDIEEQLDLFDDHIDEAVKTVNEKMSTIQAIKDDVDAFVDDWSSEDGTLSGASYSIRRYIDNGLMSKAELETVSRLEEENSLFIEKNAEGVEQILTSVNTYSVGLYSQAYGLTLEQARATLKPGTVYIPTKHGDSESHTETYEFQHDGKTYSYKVDFSSQYYYVWKHRKLTLSADNNTVDASGYIWEARVNGAGSCVSPVMLTSNYNYWYDNETLRKLTKRGWEELFSKIYKGSEAPTDGEYDYWFDTENNNFYVYNKRASDGNSPWDEEQIIIASSEPPVNSHYYYNNKEDIFYKESSPVWTEFELSPEEKLSTEPPEPYNYWYHTLGALKIRDASGGFLTISIPVYPGNTPPTNNDYLLWFDATSNTLKTRWYKVATRISNANAHISSMISQTAEGLSLSVTNMMDSYAGMDARIGDLESTVSFGTQYVVPGADPNNPNARKKGKSLVVSEAGEDSTSLSLIVKDENGVGHPLSGAEITLTTAGGEKRPSGIKLKADAIKLEGYTSVNEGFAIDNEGYMHAVGGEVGGWIIRDGELSSDVVRLISNSDSEYRITAGEATHEYDIDIIVSKAFANSKPEVDDQGPECTYTWNMSFEKFSHASNVTLKSYELQYRDGKPITVTYTEPEFTYDRVLNRYTVKIKVYASPEDMKDISIDFVLSAKFYEYPFSVGIDGVLKANGAIINGDITATSGKIGEWAVTPRLITSGYTLDQSEDGSWKRIYPKDSCGLYYSDKTPEVDKSELSWENNVYNTSLVDSNKYSPIRFFAGTTFEGVREDREDSSGMPPMHSARFQVLNDGSLYANMANIEGKITATSGKIGDWDILPNGILASTATNTRDDKTYGIGLDPRISNFDGSLDRYPYVFAIGHFVGGASGSWKNAAFKVNSNGEAYIAGGQIAGFTIEGNTLKGVSTGDSQVGLCGQSGEGYAFWAGGDTWSAPFRVGHSGEVYASDIRVPSSDGGGFYMGNNVIGKDETKIKFDVGTSQNANFPITIVWQKADLWDGDGWSFGFIVNKGDIHYDGEIFPGEVRFKIRTPDEKEEEFIFDNFKFGEFKSLIRKSQFDFDECTCLVWGGEYSNATTHSWRQVYRGSAQTKYVSGSWSENPSITITGDVVPEGNGNYKLGHSDGRWKEVWCTQSSLNSTSDRNLKNTIAPLADSYSVFFDNLKPVTYKFNDGDSGRLHVGFIAQDVESALDETGIDTKDFAGYCSWENNDGTIGYGLRYGEFIALNTCEIQKLKARVAELEEKNAKLEERLNKIEALLDAE